MGFDFKVISPQLPPHCSFSFAPECTTSFFDGLQHPLVEGCSAASCNFRVLTGVDEHMSFHTAIVSSVQFSSATQLCLTLCDPMNRSTPGLPVHHQLPEFTQTHVHQVSDVIQPSHPLSSPSPPGPNPSQHQSLFQ